MGTLFRNSAEVPANDRSAIEVLLAELKLQFPNVLDLRWSPEDASLLEVYTGHLAGPKTGDGNLVTLRKLDDKWQVISVDVWAA